MMSLRTEFTVQLITEAGTPVPSTQILVTNRTNGNLVMPFADEFSSTYVPNLQTNTLGIAQAWLPFGAYQTYANSPLLASPYTQAFDIVPIGSVTASGGGSGGGLAVITILNQVSSGGALTVASHTPVNAASAPITMTLPTGSAAGTLISVEKFDSSTNIVSITGNIRETAAQTIHLSLQHETLLLEASSTGSWWPIGGFTDGDVLNSTYLKSASNLSDLANAGTARTNLGLGTAATQNSTAFDAAGTSAAETTRAEAAEALLAPLASPALTGVPTAPTASPGTSTTQIATTAFVQSVASGVSSVFGRTGFVTAQTGDYNVAQVTGAAPLVSAALTGIPTVPTALSTSSSGTQIANLNYVNYAESTRALQTNPTISGLVTASGYNATGVTGTTSGRWLGATTSGAPATGLFYPGDFVVDKSGTFRICTTAGSPGTWVTPYGTGGGGGGSTLSSRQFGGTTDTLVITDANNVVESTGSSAATETIPLHSSVAFPVNTIVEFCQVGTGQVTIVGGGGSSPPALIQKVYLNSAGTGSNNSFTVTLSGVTNGNSLLLRATCGSSAGVGAFTVSDNNGGSWSSQYAPTDGSYYSDALWEAPNHPGGTTTVTVAAAHTPDAGGLALYLSEWSNLGSLNSSAITTGTSVTPASPSMTPASTPSLIFFGMLSVSNAPSASPGAPWTADAGATIFGNNLLPIAYQSVSTITAYSTSWTLPSSGAWHVMGGIFPAPGSGSVTLVSDGGKVKTAAQWATISARQRVQDIWVLSGDLA